MEAQKIIITGGATRIGAAIVEKLSGFNKEIVIQYNKSKSNAEALKRKLSLRGTKIYLIKADLSKDKDVKKIIKFAKTKLKYFDCLINNASLFENDKIENFCVAPLCKRAERKAILKSSLLTDIYSFKNKLIFR